MKLTYYEEACHEITLDFPEITDIEQLDDPKVEQAARDKFFEVLDTRDGRWDKTDIENVRIYDTENGE